MVAWLNEDGRLLLFCPSRPMSPGKICSNAKAKKRLWRQLIRCAQALKIWNQWIISTTGEVRCQQSADRSLGYSNSILADGTVDIVCNFPKPMALVLGDAYESRPGVFHRDLRQHWKTLSLIHI